ncbi:hypothetical protein GW17_00051635 [Ensete ventricosum]|nr:hypothetical protein GW17_00051635 [Ensete ventricosum]
MHWRGFAPSFLLPAIAKAYSPCEDSSRSLQEAADELAPRLEIILHHLLSDAVGSELNQRPRVVVASACAQLSPARGERSRGDYRTGTEMNSVHWYGPISQTLCSTISYYLVRSVCTSLIVDWYARYSLVQLGTLVYHVSEYLVQLGMYHTDS